MVQKVLIILTALVALIINMAQAKAQLSTNPWLEANDEEAIAEVYEKQNRRSRQQNLRYTPGGTVTIDRTSAYIQPGENKEDEGFWDKLGNMFDSKEEETALVPNTAANRRALAAARRPAPAQQDDSWTSAYDVGGQLGKLQKNFSLPNLPNMDGMIRKFERASGVNLKSIGNYLK